MTSGISRPSGTDLGTDGVDLIQADRAGNQARVLHTHGDAAETTVGTITAPASGSEGAGMPESIGGDVRPRPVAQMTMVSPGCTGLVGVTSSPLSARVMVARPVSRSRGAGAEDARARPAGSRS